MMRVAFDTGPLHGPITGVGRAVEAMAAHSTVDIVPYVLSFRAALRADTVRLPYPAALALRAWGRFDHPRPDRHLGDVALVHGTNYVVPPSRHPRLVTVYDCWALEHPGAVHRDIGLMMNAMRRAIDTGAHVHASSHATADRLRSHFPDAPITVIHLGAPTTIIPIDDATNNRAIGVPDDGDVIVSIGTSERRKNLPFLVSLMDDLVGVVPSARLVIAGGDGDDSAAVHATLNRLGSAARERVHVLGRVDDATIGRLYHRARVIAYPSLDEGFGSRPGGDGNGRPRGGLDGRIHPRGRRRRRVVVPAERPCRMARIPPHRPHRRRATRPNDRGWTTANRSVRLVAHRAGARTPLPGSRQWRVNRQE